MAESVAVIVPDETTLHLLFCERFWQEVEGLISRHGIAIGNPAAEHKEWFPFLAWGMLSDVGMRARLWQLAMECILPARATHD